MFLSWVAIVLIVAVAGIGGVITQLPSALDLAWVGVIAIGALIIGLFALFK